jgi:hypothetical protein
LVVEWRTASVSANVANAPTVLIKTGERATWLCYIPYQEQNTEVNYGGSSGGQRRSNQHGRPPVHGLRALETVQIALPG